MKQVATVLLIAGALLAGVTALTHTSNSVNGEQCVGDNYRRCPEVCDNEHCTCMIRNNTGVAPIACFPPEYKVCSVIGDPTVHSFSNETLDYRIPCEYLLTGGDVDIFDAFGEHTGVDYSFKVFAYNRRTRGKFFPAGFRVDVERNVGMSSTTLAFRVDGRAIFGEYTYTTSASIDGGSMWFDFVDKSSNPILNVDGYSLSYDSSHNRFYFEYPEIGLNIVFRATDDGYRWYNQEYLSGIVVGLEPLESFTYNNNGFCFSPTFMSSFAINNAYIREAGLMLFAANRNDISQTFSGSSDECLDLEEPVNTCSDIPSRTPAINKCIAVFQDEEFVNCTASSDGPGESGSVLTLFKNCILTHCHQNFTGCLAMTQVTNTDCVEFTPAGLSGFNCNGLT